jgi:RNA polymerase sigma-70 factor (ECF subfamily)
MMEGPSHSKFVKRFPVTMSDAVSNTSTTLIRRAKADDNEAWSRLVNLYSRRVYRWCRKAGLQPADASNVVQDVLRSVARKLKDFHHEKPQDTFRGWIRRITQNKLNDHFRRESKQVARPRGGSDAHRQLLHFASVSSDAESTWATTPKSNDVQITHDALARIRNEFSDRDWRMFWRVVVDGQSAVEVGEEFGVTGNAVRIVKMRLLKRLRSQLQPDLTWKTCKTDDS